MLWHNTRCTQLLECPRSCGGHLSIKSHSEIRPQESAARLSHFHDLIVGSVQGIIQPAQFLENKDRNNQ